MHTLDGKRSPWGTIDHSRELIPGLWNVGTPSHGGVFLTAERRAMMPTGLRQESWYEEDCDWAIPYYVFREEIAATGNPYALRALDGVEGTLRRWQDATTLRKLGLTPVTV